MELDKQNLVHMFLEFILQSLPNEWERLGSVDKFLTYLKNKYINENIY